MEPGSGTGPRTGHPGCLRPARMDAASEKLSARVRLFGCVATTMATAESAASLARAAESSVVGRPSRAAATSTADAGLLTLPSVPLVVSRADRVSRVSATDLDFGVSLQATVRRTNNQVKRETRIDRE